MWFNSTLREEPYLGLTSSGGALEITCPSCRRTGAAWLSSARAVRCWVKSRNERNPYFQLPSGEAGHSGETAVVRRRKVGMTSSQHGPYVQGYTRATMAGTKGSETARLSESRKAGLSPDCRLQFACMKSESLVTAGQLHCGEYVP